jgi:ATP-dependent DNA helicase RecG
MKPPLQIATANVGGAPQMKEQSITTEEALRLSSRAEDHFFDRKAPGLDGVKLQKLVVAFANADGGELIIGIADEKEEVDPAKRWRGLAAIEDFNSLLQAVHTLNPPIEAKYEFLKHANAYALRVFVERGADINKTSNGKVYQRFGAQSLPLAADKITELGFAKGARSFENMKATGILPEQVVDSKELKTFLKDVSPSTDPLEFAVNQHLVDEKSWSPLVAGVLLFSDIPQAILPRKCGVRISRYETRADDPEREHLKESHYIEGPAYRLTHDSVDLITSILNELSKRADKGATPISYPPEAIWEVFVNAIIHRDYSISDDVHVTIFNDRLVIASPGRLPGYVRVDNILDARFSRNSKIVRCLNRYKDAPNKDMGEGLNTAFQKMKEWKLKPPVIEEDGNYIKVTIRHAPRALPAEAILAWLETHPEITNAQARILTGIKSENAVKKEFYKLRDQGAIERVPDKGGGQAAWRKSKGARGPHG